MSTQEQNTPIDRAKKLYEMKDELQGIADYIQSTHAPNTGDFRTDFMLKVCEMMDLLIPEATKVTRKIQRHDD